MEERKIFDCATSLRKQFGSMRNRMWVFVQSGDMVAAYFSNLLDYCRGIGRHSDGRSFRHVDRRKLLRRLGRLDANQWLPIKRACSQLIRILAATKRAEFHNEMKLTT